MVLKENKYSEVIYERYQKNVLELIDEKFDMYLVQENPTKCDTFLRILIEDWEKGKAAKEIIVSPSGRVEERKFKDYETFYFQKKIERILMLEKSKRLYNNK